MAEPSSQQNVSRPALRSGVLFTAILGITACLAFVGLSGVADGKSGQRAVLGATKNKVTPNCGTRATGRDCVAVGKLTGFQSLQKGVTGRNFVVPFNRGKVVAWSIQLSNPTRKASREYGAAQMPYFNRLFGSPSKAGITILRQVEKNRKGPPRYKLIRASGTQVLNPYFGTEVKFAIRPLNVIKGDIVALTIPTWAPAFWVPRACNVLATNDYLNPARCANAQKYNTWRASRAPTRCVVGTDDFDRPNEALQKSYPQAKTNSVRAYGCYYVGSRLLYKATVVAQ